MKDGFAFPDNVQMVPPGSDVTQDGENAIENFMLTLLADSTITMCSRMTTT